MPSRNFKYSWAVRWTYLPNTLRNIRHINRALYRILDISTKHIPGENVQYFLSPVEMCNIPGLFARFVRRTFYKILDISTGNFIEYFYFFTGCIFGENVQYSLKWRAETSNILDCSADISTGTFNYYWTYRPGILLNIGHFDQTYSRWKCPTFLKPGKNVQYSWAVASTSLPNILRNIAHIHRALYRILYNFTKCISADNIQYSLKWPAQTSNIPRLFGGHFHRTL